jgi:hypothetical protein
MSTPGDIGLTSQPGFVEWWIRFAQRRKYGNSPVAKYNHAFMVVGTDGELIQATGSGMARGNLRDYAGQDVTLVRPPYPNGPSAAVATMEELLAAHDNYGWLTIASVALTLMTGTKLRFGLSGTEICSGAVAYALTRSDIDCGDDESFDTPADLAEIVATHGWQVLPRLAA